MNKGQKRGRAEFDVLRRIIEERDKRKWTDYTLSEGAGFPPSTLSTWFHRKTEPSIASVEKVCKSFGISLSEFFNNDVNSVCYLTPAQKELLDQWGRLTPTQRGVVFEVIKTFNED